MVAFGFGEVIGGFLHGLLIDKIGSKKAVIVNLAIIVCVIGATIISLNSLQYNFYTFIMCFTWGYEDGSQNIFLF
jgi:predicted MFS family arabinose efflux permease